MRLGTLTRAGRIRRRENASNSKSRIRKKSLETPRPFRIRWGIVGKEYDRIRNLTEIRIRPAVIFRKAQKNPEMILRV
jgi:hypothetical protein